MEIAELIEIALASSEEGRVEIAALEDAEVSIEAVGGLSQLIAELVDNAIAFSDPDDTIRVTGLFDEGDNYLISISDRGVGVPEHLLAGLNSVLADPGSSAELEPKLGIALVARLAARHDIEVRLVPGVPGTTARVTVPSRLVHRTEEPSAPPRERSGNRRLRELEVALKSSERSEPGPGAEEDADATVDLARLERSIRSRHDIVAISDESRREAESFLKKVFGPLKRQPGMTERPSSRPPSNGTGADSPPPDRPVARPESSGTVTKLRIRVPGENFSLHEDDPSTVAAERAIDIRSALSRYAQGRKSAERGDRDQRPDRSE